MSQPRASVIICNDVASHLETKNLSFIEAFDSLSSTRFPARATFYAVAKVWGMPDASTRSLILRVVGEDGTEVARAGEHKIPPAGSVRVHTAISKFVSTQFPGPGIYEAQALFEDQVIGAVPLQINQVTGS